MRKSILAGMTAVAGALFLIQCGDPGSRVSFVGTWEIVQENGITGSKESEKVAVSVDKKMFRTVSTEGRYETTSVYDGEALFTKFRETTPSEPDPQGAGPAPDAASPDSSAPVKKSSQVQSETMSYAHTGSRRFWERSYVGEGVPGGQIAGHDTVLYQLREKRPDGEITVQGWVDASTGIVLKSVETIYSSQINSMVSKTSRECKEIKYGPVDASVFNRP